MNKLVLETGLTHMNLGGRKIKGNIKFGSVAGEKEMGMNIPLAIGGVRSGVDGN